MTFKTTPAERAETVASSYFRANTFGRHEGNWGACEMVEIAPGQRAYELTLKTGEEFIFRHTGRLWSVTNLATAFEALDSDREEAFRMALEPA